MINILIWCTDSILFVNHGRMIEIESQKISLVINWAALLREEIKDHCILYKVLQ